MCLRPYPSFFILNLRVRSDCELSNNYPINTQHNITKMCWASQCQPIKPHNCPHLRDTFEPVYYSPQPSWPLLPTTLLEIPCFRHSKLSQHVTKVIYMLKHICTVWHIVGEAQKGQMTFWPWSNKWCVVTKNVKHMFLHETIIIK